MVDIIEKQSIDCNKQWKTHTTSIVDRLLLLSSAIVTLVALAWVLWYSCYGIDFTDESFYLIWISNPFKYSVSTTQFGFIYHPLYDLLSGDIAALRQVNILITFGLAWALVNVFVITVFGDQCFERTPRLIISGSIATAALTSLVFAGLWLPTPSYNSLALQAMLVAVTGLLLANKNTTRASIIGWLLIGIGGWLAFMAKPTTAAALGLCISFYLLLAEKLSVRLLAFSVATSVGFIVLSAFIIDGSIITFIDRLKGGAELLKILDGGHTFAQALRLDNFQFSDRGKLFLNAGAVVIFFATYFSQAKNKSVMLGNALLSITFAIASLAIVFGMVDKNLYASQFQGLLLWSVPFAAILTGFALYRFKGLLQISRPQWALALSFLVLPHVYAFGTNGNYWSAGAAAGIFWVLAGLVLLSPIAPNQNFQALLLPLGLAVQLITVILVQTGIETPYRQPQPLRDNDNRLEIGNPGSMLVLSEGFARYFSQAIDLAKQAEFKKGTPVIDLTGRSPGILYAIGASSIGQAWTIGGYSGSEKFTVEMLKKVPCEQISKAWVLVEPEGPRKIATEILLNFGANTATDFEVVGTFKTAEGAGGYKEVRVQQLLKPVRSVDAAINACGTAKVIMK